MQYLIHLFFSFAIFNYYIMQQVLTKAYRTMNVINQDEAFDTLNHVKQMISSNAGVSL